MASNPASRREILRRAIAGAVAAATPLSVIKAATQEGKPIILDLQDGGALNVTKTGKRYTAVRQSDAGDVLDPKPTGSFKLKTGEVVKIKKGLITQANVKPGLALRGGEADWSLVVFFR
jgi:hypothetical protein